MKKILLILACFTTSCWAKPYASVGVGRFSGTKELPSAFLGSFEAGLTSHGLGLSVEGSYIQQSMKDHIEPSGTVTLIPVFLTANVFAPYKSTRIHLGLGFGPVLSDLEVSGETAMLNRVRSYENKTYDLETGLGFEAKTGVEWKVGPHASLGFEVGFFDYHTTLTEIVKRLDLISGETMSFDSKIDFSSVIGKMVFRFY